MGMDKETLKEYKLSLVQQYTNFRETSSKELFQAEAELLINDLKKFVPGSIEADSADRMRKYILHMAHQMNWELEGTERVDVERVDRWCVNNGYLKKHLMEYSYSELPKLVSQFGIVYKDYLNRV